MTTVEGLSFHRDTEQCSGYECIIFHNDVNMSQWHTSGSWFLTEKGKSAAVQQWLYFALYDVIYGLLNYDPRTPTRTPTTVYRYVTLIKKNLGIQKGIILKINKT